MYVMNIRFEWDSDKAATNAAKHGITFDEAIEVFKDPNAIDTFDADNSIYEDRFRLIGLSSNRILTVVYVERDGDMIRIISARKATAKETRRYEQG